VAWLGLRLYDFTQIALCVFIQSSHQFFIGFAPSNVDPAFCGFKVVEVNSSAFDTVQLFWTSDQDEILVNHVYNYAFFSSLSSNNFDTDSADINCWHSSFHLPIFDGLSHSPNAFITSSTPFQNQTVNDEAEGVEDLVGS